eukprot:11178712-Lingulodinium_polyedra.AAC.1
MVLADVRDVDSAKFTLVARGHAQIGRALGHGRSPARAWMSALAVTDPARCPLAVANCSAAPR